MIWELIWLVVKEFWNPIAKQQITHVIDTTFVAELVVEEEWPNPWMSLFSIKSNAILSLKSIVYILLSSIFRCIHVLKSIMISENMLDYDLSRFGRDR